MGTSSMPTTLTSWGTRSPQTRNPETTPNATSSVAAKAAVKPAPHATRSSTARDPPVSDIGAWTTRPSSMGIPARFSAAR